MRGELLLQVREVCERNAWWEEILVLGSLKCA